MKRLIANTCPDCNVPMRPEPRTILSGKIGPSSTHRYVYENFECGKCGMKVAKLIKDQFPAGDA